MKKIIAVTMLVLAMVTMCACSSKVARGTTDGNAYTNESLNLKFTKPTGWVFYTDEQIAQQMGITAEMLQDQDLADENVKEVFEFMCVDLINRNNVNMSIVRGTGSVDEYIETLKEQLKSQMALSYTFQDEITEVKLGGKTYKKLLAKAAISGASMDQYLYVAKVGSFFVQITATDVTGIGDDTIELSFSKVD